MCALYKYATVYGCLKPHMPYITYILWSFPLNKMCYWGYNTTGMQINWLPPYKLIIWLFKQTLSLLAAYNAIYWTLRKKHNETTKINWFRSIAAWHIDAFLQSCSVSIALTGYVDNIENIPFAQSSGSSAAPQNCFGFWHNQFELLLRLLLGHLFLIYFYSLDKRLTHNNNAKVFYAADFSNIFLVGWRWLAYAYVLEIENSTI